MAYCYDRPWYSGLRGEGEGGVQPAMHPIGHTEPHPSPSPRSPLLCLTVGDQDYGTQLFVFAGGWGSSLRYYIEGSIAVPHLS